MRLRTPWQAAARVGLRLPAAGRMTLAHEELLSRAFGEPSSARPRRPGLVRLRSIETPLAAAHEDVARLGWPTEGSWCE